MREGESHISAARLATAFDELRVRLSGLDDCYARLYEIAEFLSSVLSQAPRTSATPYLLELHDDLKAATAFLSPPEANPARLEWALREVQRWSDDVPAPAKAGYREVVVRMKQEIIVNAALLGSFEPAASFLGINLAHVEATGSTTANANLLTDIIAIHRPGWSDAVARRAAKSVSMDEGGTWARFPAVYSWSDRDAHSQRAVRGQLCFAGFHITKKSKGEDALRLNGTALMQEGETHFLDDVARAGRQMLRQVAPETLAFGYSGVFHLPSQARLEGRSMRSLLAVLYVLEVIRFSDLRMSLELGTSIVLSGDIDQDGRLAAMDERSIAPKVEAAFFSRTARLILPREHQEEARRIADQLHASYPHRRLTISGVESIFDIFADRRLIRQVTKSRTRYALEQTWKNRSKIVSTAAVLLLFASAFLLYPNRIDPHIVDSLLDEGFLRFVNDEGETVHGVMVGDRMHATPSSKGIRLVAIGDVNGDGLNDAFWGTQLDFEKNRRGEVTGIDGATGDTLFHFLPKFELNYPNDVSIINHDMVPGDMTLLDTNNDGWLELLVAFEHAEYYPSILASFNPLTKDVIQRYDHPGALREMTVADLNADGRNEILLSGINNSMRQPVFLALDPSDFSDTGPVTRTSYKPFPERIGKELAYYAFPESPITQYSKMGTRIADWINVLPNGQVTVSVWDAYRIVDETPITTAYRVTFDQQLRPISIGTNDDWDAVYQEAASKGIVPNDFSNDMKLEMLSNIERIK